MRHRATAEFSQCFLSKNSHSFHLFVGKYLLNLALFVFQIFSNLDLDTVIFECLSVKWLQMIQGVSSLNKCKPFGKFS